MSSRQHKKTDYDPTAEFSLEVAIEQIEALLSAEYALAKRAVALLVLQRDEEVLALVREKDPDNMPRITALILQTENYYDQPLDYLIAMQRQRQASDIMRQVGRPGEKSGVSFREFLSRITMNPVTGVPILLLVLYWGLYKFVGEFGAGTLVDFLESSVFEGYINPFVTKITHAVIPWEIVRSLFVGEYGILTLGARYAIAIILPIVSIFFLFFSVIEDTGYLPRLAMLIDSVFKKIGLSGRAVIPMVLGFGCDTMATMVTRTLPTKRERLIATMLLALAVPCSAQLGVIMAMLEGKRFALGIWAAVIALVFLFIGFLTARVLPGQRPTFYMEVPPLRLPKLSNVFVKTYTRVKWYLKEVLPIFVFASALIWLGQITGLFDLAIRVLEAPVRLIGLPEDAAEVFLFGFFRRDYGAAGLYDLNKTGILTTRQLLVACIALTLFLPCIAQLLMNIKERGLKTGLAISMLTLFFSFSVAFLVNKLLVSTGLIL